MRHELDMVQKLTGELAVLQARMAQTPGSENAAPNGGNDRPSKERRSLPTADRKKEGTKPHLDRAHIEVIAASQGRRSHEAT